MLQKIIAFSVSNKLIIGVLVLALVGWGVYQAGRLPIDAVPDITNNQVQIITVSPSLGAPDVERLITFPIEQANNNIPGKKEIRSFSRFGLSVVTIVFEDATDIYWARQQVSERLQRVQSQIPPGVGTPELAPVTTGLGEIYQYTVRAKPGFEDKYNATELRSIQDWVVRRQLLGVKGVADVSSFGGYLKQYEIALDPAKLKANNLSINDVFTALENNNENTGGAYIEKGPTVLFIRTEGLVGSIDDIQNIVVKNLSDGAPVLIRNIADVGFGHATRYGAMTYNGQGEVSGAVVMMLKGANSNEVIRNIKDRVAQIQQTLPEGVLIDAFLDRTKMVNNAIGTVERNLMEGALIVVLVLVLFLGNLRAGLLVASVIPLSMLFAVIMMNVFGVSGNLMSLGALDFGLIVDGAVIIVEAVMHRFHSRSYDKVTLLDQSQMNTEVNHAASRMMNSAVFGQIIILIVYLPIFTLQGIEGKMFKPMAQTVAFALLGAFLLSLTYIPMMSALVLNRKISHIPNVSARMMSRLENVYERTLNRVLHFPKLVIGTSLVLLVAAILVLTTLGGEFIPSLEEGDYAIETRVLTGSSLNTSIKAVSQGSKILLEQFPEVQKVVGKTGSSEIPTDPMPVDASDMIVILKDKKHWVSAKSFDELTEKMSKALEAVPGVTFGFQFPVQMRFNELMTGARQDVVCKIFGENLDTLAILAKKLGDLASRVKGAKDVYVETVTGMPQIVIDYNRPAIAQYGLNVSDINRVVNAAFAGQITGQVYEGEKRFDLVVRLSSAQRQNLSDVQNLLIPTSQGYQIPLNLLAKVSIQEGPNQIQREEAQRRIIVGFNVRGRDVQSMVAELQQQVQQHIKLPPAYHVTYGGAFENLQAAKRRLSIAVPVSLLLIFVMLYFAFNSVRLGLLIYSAIPLSAIGGIFALAIRGMPFSISAGIGFIALFGVAVLNGIVLIAEFNRLRNEEQVKDIREVVMQGTKSRLRPVLITASVASLGFLPMALSQGAGAEVQRPLATVVIGGLVLATFLTLFVLPALYILFNKKSFLKMKTGNGVAVLLLIAACSGAGDALAQEPIRLQAAIDTALRNNLSLKSQQLATEQLKQLRGTGTDIPQTQLTSDIGQINSAYTDTKFTVSQSIRFPTVYARQHFVLDQQWKAGQLNVALQEKDLRKRVAGIFFDMLYLEQKIILLRHTDSLYADFLTRARQRFDVGESNVLEKTTAETSRGQVALQLQEVQQDYSILQTQLTRLLGSSVDYVPKEPSYKMELHIAPDTSLLGQHPYLKLLSQEQTVSTAKLSLEKSRLSPDLFVGYTNASIRGIGADEKAYTAGKRFNAAQLGIGIPLFAGAQRSRISAARIEQQLADNRYADGVKLLQSDYQQAVQTYYKQLNAVNYFEKSALQQASTILATADQQFLGGDINYLEWTLLTNQAITIQSDYLDAVRSLNRSIIDLQSFISN